MIAIAGPAFNSEKSIFYNYFIQVCQLINGASTVRLLIEKLSEKKFDED